MDGAKLLFPILCEHNAKSFNVECLAKMWTERDDNHGWDTVFNIIGGND